MIRKFVFPQLICGCAKSSSLESTTFMDFLLLQACAHFDIPLEIVTPSVALSLCGHMCRRREVWDCGL